MALGIVAGTGEPWSVCWHESCTTELLTSFHPSGLCKEHHHQHRQQIGRDLETLNAGTRKRQKRTSSERRAAKRAA